MIHYGGITFYNTIDGKIGAVSSVGDFFILEDSESCFDGLSCAGTGSEESHTHLNRTVAVSSKAQGLQGSLESISRNTGLEVYVLILMTMKPSSGVDKDSRHCFGSVCHFHLPIESAIGSVRGGS
jgi:hypothetical protein